MISFKSIVRATQDALNKANDLKYRLLGKYFADAPDTDIRLLNQPADHEIRETISDFFAGAVESHETVQLIQVEEIAEDQKNAWIEDEALIPAPGYIESEYGPEYVVQPVAVMATAVPEVVTPELIKTASRHELHHLSISRSVLSQIDNALLAAISHHPAGGMGYSIKYNFSNGVSNQEAMKSDGFVAPFHSGIPSILESYIKVT